MSKITLSGALKDLKQVDINDISHYKQAVTEGEQIGFAYYFPYLLSYNRPDHSNILLIHDQNSVCVFRLTTTDTKSRLDIHSAPTPLNINALQRCLERANDFNNDKSARILKVDAKDAAIIASVPNLQIKERKSQYLYSPESFNDISGGKYRTVRRMISKIQAIDNVQVLPYSVNHTQACLKLLREWKKHHRQLHGTKGGVGSTKRVLDLATTFHKPNMHGEVIMINNQLKGFAFGGEIRPGYAAFVEAKCDVSIQGLSYFQRYHFMSKLQHCKVVNDGPDVGRAGLAQLKNSLRPIGMHTEYRATQV